MVDVKHGVTQGDSRTGNARGGTTDPLMDACEDFAEAFEVWELLTKEIGAVASPSEITKYKDIRETKQQWQEALARVRASPAFTREGLEAKRQVLSSLSHFAHSDDPSFSDFAIELVEEYHRFLSVKLGDATPSVRPLNGHIGPSDGPRDSTSKVIGRFSLQNIFGIFHN